MLTAQTTSNRSVTAVGFKLTARPSMQSQLEAEVALAKHGRRKTDRTCLEAYEFALRQLKEVGK
jgi:hypothetical protein